MSLLPELNKDRYEHIASKTKGKYSADDIAKLHQEGKGLTFSIMVAGDSPIDSIKGYSDFAEYQYDLSDGVWRYRTLHGCWKETKQNDEFSLLTQKAVK